MYPPKIVSVIWAVLEACTVKGMILSKYNTELGPGSLAVYNCSSNLNLNHNLNNRRINKEKQGYKMHASIFRNIMSDEPESLVEEDSDYYQIRDKNAVRSLTKRETVYIRDREYLETLSKNISTILDSFSHNYDKKVRPNYGGEAVEVGITMYVLSISALSEVQMDFTLDFYFRQMWKDPRLTFEGPKGVKTLSVGNEFLESIWVPDTFFVNEKTSYFHTATTSNEFLRISQHGDITRSIRLTITASCSMDLRYFPMDSQLCFIEIESFGYTMSDIRYKWNDGLKSVGVSQKVSLPQFKVLGYRQKKIEVSLSTGNYSRLVCEILFVRSMGYYLIQIYIPSSLIVVISWVSFWLNRNAAPARVYLGITTVLTMTTLMSSTNKALPKISYVKSIDVYLGTCFVMVFAALLEYATVGYMAKRIQMRKNHFAVLQKMALQLQTVREEQQQLAAAAAAAATASSSGMLGRPQTQQPGQVQQQQQQQQQQQHVYLRRGQTNPDYCDNLRSSQYLQQTAGSRKYGSMMGQQASSTSTLHCDVNAAAAAGVAASSTTPGIGLVGPSSSSNFQSTSQGQQSHPGGVFLYQDSQFFHNDDKQSCSYTQASHRTFHPQYSGTPAASGNVPTPNPGHRQPVDQSTIQQVVWEEQDAKIRQIIPINPNQICGITPSDIDKYSRVVFPVCFICFNLLYWIVYLHISSVDPGDLVLLAAPPES